MNVEIGAQDVNWLEIR